MNEDKIQELVMRGEKSAFLIGTIIGQMSSLLNEIKSTDIDKMGIYKELHDIWKQAGLQVHGLYYKYYLDNVKKELNIDSD